MGLAAILEFDEFVLYTAYTDFLEREIERLPREWIPLPDNEVVALGNLLCVIAERIEQLTGIEHKRDSGMYGNLTSLTSLDDLFEEIDIHVKLLDITTLGTSFTIRLYGDSEVVLLGNTGEKNDNLSRIARG